MFHLKTKVQHIEVSTIELCGYNPAKYETCLFHDNGDSTVVDRYDKVDTATTKHNEYVQKLRGGWLPNFN